MLISKGKPALKMFIFCVFICFASLTLQLLVSLNIHNQCNDINLTSPVYFIHGGKWLVTPDQEIDVNTVMQNHIEIGSGQDTLKGALAYRIHRKHTESDEPVQGESKQIWLLVAWCGEHTKGPDVCALVIEYNKRLDEDRLKKLHKKRWPLLKAKDNTTKNSWAFDDTTMLATTTKVTNRGYKWDIFISEERK
jgi:hypothetical protein